MTYTKEQRETLKLYEDRLSTACYHEYARNLSRTAWDDLKRIYRETHNGKDTTLNLGCSHCVLTFLREIGYPYFEDLKLIEAETQKLIEATNDLGDSASRAAQLVKALDEVMADVPTDEPVSKELEPKPAKKPAPKKSNKKATKK